jgi:hypothetical protein
MAKAKQPAAITNATVQISTNLWERFKKKCKKAGTNASERFRELVAADLKV